MEASRKVVLNHHVLEDHGWTSRETSPESQIQHLDLTTHPVPHFIHPLSSTVWGFLNAWNKTPDTHTQRIILGAKTQQLVVGLFKECKNITPYLQEVNVQERKHSQQNSKEQLPCHQSKSHNPSLMEGKKVKEKEMQGITKTGISTDEPDTRTSLF